MISWGVIGFGRMGKTFANCFNHINKDFELKGFASISKDTNTNLKKYKSYDDIINSSEIDAVYISTLNNTHKDLVIKSIKKNKKVLCEKPLGLNFKEVKEIYNIIKDKTDVFFEALAYRSHPQTIKLLELLRNQNFGEIIKIKANFGFKNKRIKKDSRLFNKDLGGGSILDLGCYPISFFSLFANKLEDIEILKSDFNLCETGVDIDGEIHLKINNKIDAIGKVSLVENLDNICKIYCKNATIIVTSPWLPPEKTFLEIETKGGYFKEFINTDKNVYTHQLKKVSLIFNNNKIENNFLVDIEESYKISNLMEGWLKQV